MKQSGLSSKYAFDKSNISNSTQREIPPVNRIMEKLDEQSMLLFPIPLGRLLDSFRQIVKEEISADRTKENMEKLLSPAETCKMFNPPISKVTLSAWTKKGLLQEHRISGRIFYKLSEILEGLTTLKRYKN